MVRGRIKSSRSLLSPREARDHSLPQAEAMALAAGDPVVLGRAGSDAIAEAKKLEILAQGKSSLIKENISWVV